MMGCVFCDIAEGKISAKKVYEDGKILAFDDIAPQAPVHVVVIPKKHISSVVLLGNDDKDLLSGIFKVISDVAKKKKIDDTGFRVVVNNGKDAGQAVAHLHFHVIGGRSMEWPPG